MSTGWAWPFSCRYSSKVQQRSGAELLAEPPSRLERLGVRDLRVDVHRHVNLRVAQDPHSHPGIKAARAARSRTGASRAALWLEARSRGRAARSAVRPQLMIGSSPASDCPASTGTRQRRFASLRDDLTATLGRTRPRVAGSGSYRGNGRLAGTNLSVLP